MPKLPTSVESKADEIKWRAESLVSDAMRGTAKFKRAVRDTIKELKQQDKRVKKIVLGGNND